MSLMKLLGNKNSPKEITLPTSIKRKIAKYVAENLKKDSDEFFFWSDVNSSFVKPAGIKCLASDVKDIYNSHISKENWISNDPDVELEKGNSDKPRLTNGTPILVGKLDESELNEIKAVYERHNIDSERDQVMGQLAEYFCSNGISVGKVDLIRLYEGLFATKKHVSGPEFKFQKLPTTFYGWSIHGGPEFSENILPPQIFKGDKFIILWKNVDPLMLAKARELEYLILIYGGTLEFFEDGTNSKDVVPLCIDRAGEAIHEFIMKYEFIYNGNLVQESIKNGFYNKTMNNCYLINTPGDIL